MNLYKIVLIVPIVISLLSAGKIELGRDNDPKTTDDINSLTLLYRKAIWSTLSLPGQRFMSGLIFDNLSISHMNTNNSVAFTIDDGFCGIDNPNGCMINEVRELFKRYDAKATFFITGSHCKYTSKEEVKLLLNDGHELANHSMYDYPYNEYSAEDFQNDLDETNDIISQYTNIKTKWYRAPHAKISANMKKVLHDNNLVHVISDSFANDTAIPDSKWIAKFILNNVQEGSIIVIHMPERGVREWLYEAMELTLIGLKDMNLNALTLTELEALEKK